MLNFLIILLIKIISDSLSSCEVFLISFFSEITTVSSPFGSLVNNSNSSMFFLIYSSYNFDISRQKTIFLPLKKILSSGIILLIFLETQKKLKWNSILRVFLNHL